MSVLVDLDLLLDLRGLQFCLLRTSEYLENSKIADLFGLPILRESSPSVSVLPRLPTYLPTTKPRIHAYSFSTFHTVSALKVANRPVKVFSFVEEGVLTEVLKRFPWVPEPVTYVNNENYRERIGDVARKGDLVLIHSTHLAEELQILGVQATCVAVTKYQSTPIQSLLTSIPGLTPPPLDEFSFWKSHYLLPNAVRINGTVVHGFGRGSAELGYPTANIVPNQSRVTAQLVPGVYCGYVTLENSSVYKAAISLGWNPQYDNTAKTTEVYILHSFQESFYGQKLTLFLVAYLRAESAFASVDDLIKAIQYDVRLTEEILN